MSAKYKKYNIKFVKHSKIVVLCITLIFSYFTYSFFTKGFNLGVDFSGGIVFEIRPEKNIKVSDLRKSLEKEVKKLPISELNIQEVLGSDDILLKIGEKTTSNKERIKLVEDLKSLIIEYTGEKTEFRKTDYVGPQVGEELIRNGILAITLSFIGMMIYIWFRFEWQYGLGGILALMHDSFFVLGIYSVLGIEFNLTSIAAILTVIGYSINDSVVIYDRIRENLRKYRKMELGELIDLSLNETLSRTILTVSTVLVALFALLLVGGDALFGFSFAIFVGVFAGTFSSVYVSAPILLIFKPNQTKE